MIRLLAIAAAAHLAACSPALDWRKAALPAAALEVSLPCKPERVQRAAELAGHAVDMHMAGCEADGATLAVTCAALPDPALAGAALTHWRAAVWAAMQVPALGSPGAPQEAPYRPAGALDLPQSMRAVATSRQSDGAPIFGHAAWFARVHGPRVSVCHAIVLSTKPRPELAESLFAGLVLR